MSEYVSTKVTIHIHIENSEIERVASENGWSFARAKRETLKAARDYVQYATPELQVDTWEWQGKRKVSVAGV